MKHHSSQSAYHPVSMGMTMIIAAMTNDDFAKLPHESGHYEAFRKAPHVDLHQAWDGVASVLSMPGTAEPR
jgi:hypothetical protein